MFADTYYPGQASRQTFPAAPAMISSPRPLQMLGSRSLSRANSAFHTLVSSIHQPSGVSTVQFTIWSTDPPMNILHPSLCDQLLELCPTYMIWFLRFFSAPKVSSSTSKHVKSVWAPHYHLFFPWQAVSIGISLSLLLLGIFIPSQFLHRLRRLLIRTFASLAISPPRASIKFIRCCHLWWARLG